VEIEGKPMPAEPWLPARLGLLVASPAQALTGIFQRKRGGVRDALTLVVLGSVAFHLPELIRGLRALVRISLPSALTQIMGVFAAELRIAIIIALGSGLVVTVLAGRGRRDPAIALELGAACYLPHFVVWAPVRLLNLDAGLGFVPGAVAALARVVAWLWVAGLAGVAVWVVRRSGHEPPALTGAAPRRAHVVGLGLLGLPALALLLNSIWSAEHYAELRPLGRLDPAPDFALDRIDGKPGQIKLSELRGRVVLLDFWATWCPPCLALMPTLHELYRDWQQRGAEFVGIDADWPTRTPDEVRAFLARQPLPYPVVIDDRNAGGTYGVSSIPHIVIVGRDGRIARVFVGGVSRAQLDRALAAASE
jgi:thiol-disulfide isomerase/thioredoxin